MNKPMIIGASLLLATFSLGLGTAVHADPACTTICSLTPSENEAELSESQVYNRCYEDQPCWNCKTMGNHICGPVELPHTL